MLRHLAAIALVSALFCFASSLHGQGPLMKGDAKEGQKVFMKRCFQCHSVVQGETRFGPSLYHELSKPHPKHTDAEAKAIILNGKNKMPAWKDILTPQDVEDVIAYIHTL